MYSHVLPFAWLAERAAADEGAVAALRQLRRLGLADFAQVMLELPREDMPNLSAQLPRMPDEATQRMFNGGAGQPLLDDSLSFVRMLATRAQEIRHRPLAGARILDFGCGWGRLLRLMPFFSDPDRISGVDPFARALELCREYGVLGRLSQSDYLPRSLPMQEAPYDVIYAYSVFTHLSQRTMDMAMEALRDVVAADGLLVLTVRPSEYWQASNAQAHEVLTARHVQDGFAFVPHGGAPIDGEVTYGDSSVDIGWFARRYARWELRGFDRGQDRHQTALLLTPR